MTPRDGKTVVVLELGDGIELAEAMTILGRHFPKETGTAVHAAIQERAEAILAFAKGETSTWPPPKFPDQARVGTWPPPLQHKASGTVVHPTAADVAAHYGLSLTDAAELLAEAAESGYVTWPPLPQHKA